MTTASIVYAKDPLLRNALSSECSHADSVRPLRRADVVVHELDGEALLYDPVSMSTHRLNETGLSIWKQCDGGTSVETIYERLADQYEVSSSEAEKHVLRMVKELERQSLIHTAHPDQDRGISDRSGIERHTNLWESV